MLKKFLATAIVFTFIYAQAQDSAEAVAAKPIVTGYVDVYYRYNLSNPRKDAGVFNNYTSFTHSQNSFELNMASVKLEHSMGRVGFVADLGFGRKAEEFSYNDNNTRFVIKQAFVTYNPVNNLKLTAGSWGTHVGYEVVDPYVNRNYSMSYMFSYGPFFHTGIKADMTLGKSGFMIGLTNPTDLKSASFASKYLVAQYSVGSPDDKTKMYLNYQGGRTEEAVRVKQLDLVLTTALSSKFSLGYNGTVARSNAKVNGKYEEPVSWWGSALYLNADPAPWLGLTLRGEYFDDKKMITSVFSALPEGGDVFAATLSANFKVDNLILIPEFRIDHSSGELFVDHEGAPSKRTATVLLAAIYKF
jgi:hypothetical protein